MTMELDLGKTHLTDFNDAEQAALFNEAKVARMMAALERHLGTDPTRHLALPRQDGDEIAWTTPGLQRIAANTLSGAIADGLLLELNEWLNELHTLRVRLAHSGSETDVALAEWMKAIATRADSDDIYLVDSRPVLSNWMRPGQIAAINSAATPPGSETRASIESNEPPTVVVETATTGRQLYPALLALASLLLLVWIVLRLTAACSLGLTTSQWGIRGLDFVNHCKVSSAEADDLKVQIAELERQITETVQSCPVASEPIEPELPPVIEPREDPVEEPVEPPKEESSDPGPAANLRFVSTENANARMCVYAACNPYVRFVFRNGECESEPTWLLRKVTTVPEGICQVLVLPMDIQGTGGQTFRVDLELLFNNEVADTWSFEDTMIAPSLQDALLAVDNPHLYWAGTFTNPWASTD